MKKKDPLAVKLALTNMSALVSESATFPIDFTKTLMQSTKGQAGFIGTAKQVFQADGIGGFYRGVQPAILRHWVYTGARINLYESFRDQYSDADGHMSIPKKFACGAMAGGIAQFVASPTDLVKVQMITDARVNAVPKFRGVADCFRQLYASNGLLGMWKGVGPNVARAMAVNMGELATYDSAKRQILKTTGLPDSLPVHTMSAVVSGFVACAFSTPFDVIKTRMMSGQYTNMAACAVDTVRREGVRKLYSGFLPGWARLGPWQFFFWVSYEQLRKAGGLEGF